MPAPRHLGMFNNTIFPEPGTLFDTYEGRGRVTVIAEANSTESPRSGQLEFILESDPETKATVSLSQPNA